MKISTFNNATPAILKSTGRVVLDVQGFEEDVRAHDLLHEDLGVRQMHVGLHGLGVGPVLDAGELVRNGLAVLDFVDHLEEII